MTDTIYNELKEILIYDNTNVYEPENPYKKNEEKIKYTIVCNDSFKKKSVISYDNNYNGDKTFNNFLNKYGLYYKWVNNKQINLYEVNCY